MSTARNFSAMLNEYTPNKLLKDELLKRTWMLDNVERDDSWGGSNIIVPFRANKPSSLSLNKLTAASGVHAANYVRGSITAYNELWHAMKLQFRDIVDHEGRIPEETFLKVVSEELEGSMDFYRMGMNTLLINGASFAKAVADTDLANGVVQVDKIDKFELGQYVIIDDDNSASTSGYVRTINVDASTVTFYDARTGGSAVNLSSYTTAQNCKFYYDGAQTASFNSLRSSLLSSANGGSASIHGQTKTAYPFLQAPNISGSAITASNILDELFDALADAQQKARGGQITTALMSLKHSASIMKLIQSEKGAFHVAPNTTKVSEYGWSEVMVGSPAGNMVKIVGIQEAADDVIYLLDPKSMVFRSKGFIRKHKSPDGIEYHVTRDETDGYSYIVDLVCFGELEVSKPSNNAAIYGISY